MNDYHETRARLGFPWMPDPEAPRFSVQYHQHQADELIRRQRAAYRHRVLGAYRAFCLPLEPDEVVPDEVTILMYEQWDVDGCDAADAVNL